MKVEDSTLSFSSSATATGRTPHEAVTRHVDMAPDRTVSPPRSTSARLYDAKEDWDEGFTLSVLCPAFMNRTRCRLRQLDGRTKAFEGAGESASATSATSVATEAQKCCKGENDIIRLAVVVVRRWCGLRRSRPCLLVSCTQSFASRA